MGNNFCGFEIVLNGNPQVEGFDISLTETNWMCLHIQQFEFSYILGKNRFLQILSCGL